VSFLRLGQKVEGIMDEITDGWAAIPLNHRF
jgi:hypothetical protein